MVSTAPPSLVETGCGAARLTMIGTSTLSPAATVPGLESAVNVYSGSVGKTSVTFWAAMRPWFVMVTLNVPV